MYTIWTICINVHIQHVRWSIHLLWHTHAVLGIISCCIISFYVWKHNDVFSHESVRFNLLLHRQSCQLQHMRWTLSANMFIELLSIDWWNKLLTSQHMFLICWIYLILNHMFSALNDYECLQQSILCRSQTICFYNCTFLALGAVVNLSWGGWDAFFPMWYYLINMEIISASSYHNHKIYWLAIYSVFLTSFLLSWNIPILLRKSLKVSGIPSLPWRPGSALCSPSHGVYLWSSTKSAKQLIKYSILYCKYYI